MKRYLLPLAICAAPAAAQDLPPECDRGELHVPFSHVSAGSGHPKGEAAAELARRVNVEFDGTLCMSVHPRRAMYDDEDLLNAMIDGEPLMGAPSTTQFDRLTPRYRIFDLPFLFENMIAAQEFQISDDGLELLAALEQDGIHGLAYWSNGMRQLTASRPLDEPADAAGLTFRAQPSAVIERTFSQLDATSIRMRFGEVYDALADGSIDGQMNSFANIFAERFYEVQNCVLEANVSAGTYVVVASTPVIEALGEDLERFQFLLDEVTHERNGFTFELNELAKIRIRGDGGCVRSIPDAERADWVDALDPVQVEFTEEIGAELIEAARAASGSF